MKIYRIRFIVQMISFLILTYGGRLGVKLGYFLPCFSCPYLAGCGGNCYLMALQGPFWGLQLPFAVLGGPFGLTALAMFAGFLLLTVILSKAWCGWICPFGTLQDWLSSLRRKLGIREARFSWKMMDNLKKVKYGILFLLIIIPVLIGNGLFHADLTLPFCQVCPAKPLMPLFEGSVKYLAINFTNPITLVMSILSVSIAGFFLAGMFFRDRFFCIFCPLLALMSFFDKIGLVRLIKKPASCLACGNCRRLCPLEQRTVHDEKEKTNVISPSCMECFKCVESCPGEKTLSARFLNFPVFSSSRKNVLKKIE